MADVVIFDYIGPFVDGKGDSVLYESMKGFVAELEARRKANEEADSLMGKFGAGETVRSGL